MFVGIAPSVTGRPLSLNAYVQYVYQVPPADINANEVFHLARNQTDDGYEGQTRNRPNNIRIIIADSVYPVPDQITVQLLTNGAVLTYTVFYYAPLPGVTRWDTGTMTVVTYPYIDYARLHIMG